MDQLFRWNVEEVGGMEEYGFWCPRLPLFVVEVSGTVEAKLLSHP